MKTRFIINPISGTGKQKGIENYISKNFDIYDLFFTKKSGHAKILAKQAVRDNINLLVVIGGDGTINECLESLVNSNTILFIIPCGSGNGFAKHLAINTNIKKALISIKNSSIKLVDIGFVNNKPFINVAGIGFDAHIAKLFSKSFRRGLLSYLLIILKEIFYSANEYQIEFENIKKTVNAYMISFANSSQFGNNAKISPLAKINDGLIDFVIVKKFPKWKILFVVFKLLNGSIHNSNFVEIIRCNKMKINSTNYLVHLDGEPHKFNEQIEITILKRSIKVLTPNG